LIGFFFGSTLLIGDLGYSAGDALQKMQDERIQARTKLATQEESEKLNQKMLDFKLAKERERAEQAQQLHHAAAEAQLKIRQLQLDQSLAEQQEALELEKRAREQSLRQGTALSCFPNPQTNVMN